VGYYGGKMLIAVRDGTNIIIDELEKNCYFLERRRNIPI
jgi:hypothetical protein